MSKTLTFWKKSSPHRNRDIYAIKYGHVMPEYIADLLEHKYIDSAVSQKSEEIFNKSSHSTPSLTLCLFSGVCLKIEFLKWPENVLTFNTCSRLHKTLSLFWNIVSRNQETWTCTTLDKLTNCIVCTFVASFIICIIALQFHQF